MRSVIFRCLWVAYLCAGLLAINPGHAYSAMSWTQYQDGMMKRVIKEAKDYQNQTKCSNDEAEAYARKLLIEYGLIPPPPPLPPDIDDDELEPGS